MAPPGRPKTTSTSQASRLRMSDWAPVSFTVAPGGAVVGARKKPPARGRGGSARAAYGGGPALVDKYQGDPGRHQASCPGLRLRFSDGTGGVKRADGGTSVTDLLEGAAGFVWRGGRLIDRERGGRGVVVAECPADRPAPVRPPVPGCGAGAGAGRAGRLPEPRRRVRQRPGARSQRAGAPARGGRGGLLGAGRGRGHGRPG